MSASPPVDRAKTARIALIVVAMIAAGVVAFWSSRGETQSDDPADASPFICLDDQTVFHLTPAQFERLAREGGIQAPETMDGGVLLLRCPSTGQMNAVPAKQCPNDQTYFPGRLKDGTPGQCPRCGWSFYPRR